jgi:hypothetical protein
MNDDVVLSCCELLNRSSSDLSACLIDNQLSEAVGKKEFLGSKKGIRSMR